MKNNCSIKKSVLRYEAVHYSDDNLFIAHKADKITYIKDGEKSVITMPDQVSGFKKPFMRFRKARRLLRLDKAMISFSENGLLMVRFGEIWLYSFSDNGWTRSAQKLNCRNPMYNALLRLDGKTFYIGEYGNSNGIGKRILKSVDGGLNWECVYQFETDEIRHIHALLWDEFEEKIWIFTGDADKECRVLKADKDFENVREVGSGSQEWRACHAVFKEDSVHWIMDSPIKEVRHIRYDRVSGEIKAGESFAGPVWFAGEYGNSVLAASAQEIGPSHTDKKLHLYKTDDLIHWEEIAAFSHDGWPKKYFRFGTMTFAKGTKPFVFCEGVRGYDGKTIELKLNS